ncbi:MAG: hypothetical protein ABR552_11175, partial [Actinomycetota bacterium]
MSRGESRILLRRALAALVVVASVSSSVGVARADTRSRIAVAKQRLAALEAQIDNEQARVNALQLSLKSLSAEAALSRSLLSSIQMQLMQNRRRIEASQARYEAFRDAIDNTAAEAYMQGPGGDLVALISPGSVNALTDVYGYADSSAAKQAERARQALDLTAQLVSQRKQETALESKRADAVSRLTSQQDRLGADFVDEQTRLVHLAQARAEVGTLLVQLAKRLRAEELAAALAAASRGTPLSFGRWGQAFLSTIGAPVTRNDLVVMVAWQTAEYTTARWNPLATTYPMPGATRYNSSGVRNYVSLQQGLQATELTLAATGYGYEAILSDLRRSTDPMTTAQAINASSWCHGCANGAYVVNLIPTVEKYY